MNRKRILGLWLVSLMLAITACGKSQNTTQETVQESNANVQIAEAETQGNSKVNEASAAETEKSAIQEDEPELQEQAAETESSQEETVNDNLPTDGNYYYDLANVVLYLEIYDELPPNYITKSEAQALGWEGGSVEKYKEGAAIGGDHFGNREGLLPTADGRSYTECDIDTHGYSSRGSRRLVFSNDGLYFYTSDHYENFSEVTVTENYEVLW